MIILTRTDMCPKRTASAFSVNWIIPRKNFKITKGKYTYHELRASIDCTNNP
jgi:hypothetical protein